MCHAHNENKKKQQQIKEIIVLPNHESERPEKNKITNTWENKRIWKKRKSQKSVSDERKKLLETKFYCKNQMDKHVGCPPHKILGTILEMDKEGY